jgi:hypothetical protein
MSYRGPKLVAMESRKEANKMPADWQPSPELQAITDRILSMPVGDRLRQIEAEAHFFANIRPLDD